MSAPPGDFQTSPPAAGIWPSLNRLLFILIVMTVAAAVGWRFVPEISERRKQQARADQLKAEVDHERMVLARNQREVELLLHDREYLAIMARDRLDLMGENEVIYRFDAPRPDPAKMRLQR